MLGANLVALNMYSDIWEKINPVNNSFLVLQKIKDLGHFW